MEKVTIRTTPFNIRSVEKKENNVLPYKLESHLTHEELRKYENHTDGIETSKKK